MFRVEKVLNHNALLAVQADNKECLIIGKGIGFGKKVTEHFDVGQEDTVYRLQEDTGRGNAGSIVRSIAPECLEVANEILNLAQQKFGKVDRTILFPMADHLEFAVQRARKKEQISNPLTEDIRVLFYMEYDVASNIRPILQEKMGVTISDDEIGYVALHIHSAIEDEQVSQAMQMAKAVRECVSFVEEEIGRPLDVVSLSYNRLMNHIRYMVARALKGETIQVNLNDYVSLTFPESYQMAQSVCDQVSISLKHTLGEEEVGYLAMHIERVLHAELYTNADEDKKE